MSRCLRGLFSIVIAALLLYLMSLSYSGMKEFQKLYEGWSVRLSAPISRDRAFEIKRYCVKNAEDIKGAWPVFWTEKSMNIQKADSKSVRAVCLLYDGDGSGIWPAEFLQGAYPGELGEDCAVSDTLSWRLWGSTDCMGKELEMGGRKYAVTGIYKSAEATAMAGGRGNAEWENIDIRTDEPMIRESFEVYLAAMGVSDYDTVVDGGGLGGLVKLIWAVPVCMAGAAAAASIMSWLDNILPGEYKKWVLLSILFIFALCLPWILSRLPPWLLPSKWSDFSFWSQLFDKLKGHVTDWFSMKPTAKDTEVKLRLLRQTALMIAEAVILILFYGRPVYGTAVRGKH